MEEKIGIIDLGSNSVRLMLMKIYSNGSFKLLDEIKEGVRLSEGMGKDNILQPKAIRRTIETIRLFTKLCQTNGIEGIIAVATAAVRAATNQADFLQELAQETGLDFQVLTGEEEAYYVYQGVVNSLAVQDCLIVDIGGGSTEIAKVKNRELIESISLPFGAVTLTEQFLNKDKNTLQQIEKLECFLHESLNNISWLAQEKNVYLIGIGGTIRNIAKMDRRKRDYPLEIIHNYPLNPKNVVFLYNEIKAMNLEERKKIPGLSKDRADIIVGGFAIIKCLSDFVQAKEIIASGNGLREGLFYNYLLNKQDMVMVNSVLEHSLQNFMRFYDLGGKHVEHVCTLALTLYEHLQYLHNLGEKERQLLWVSALLHDCGIAINYYNHSRHTFYLLLNSRLNGLSHRELVMCAFICTLHSQDELKKRQLLQYKQFLKEKDYDIIYKLGIILRIATSLDRSATGIIEKVECKIKEEKVEIKTFSKSNAELEICQASRSAENFKKIYHKDLNIVSSDNAY